MQVKGRLLPQTSATVRCDKSVPEHVLDSVSNAYLRLVQQRVCAQHGHEAGPVQPWVKTNKLSEPFQSRETVTYA